MGVPTGWTWSDQSLRDYTNWAAGHPTSSSDDTYADCLAETSTEDCVETWRGGEDWNDADCGGSRAYVCGFQCGSQSLPESNATMMPQFDARPQLHNQSLSLRHVRLEGNEAFGGGGTDLGAALSLAASMLGVESVDFVGNTQRGVGAGVIFAAASNVTVAFARFEQNRNLGLGAGVLTASAGSRVAFSHAQFLGNAADNQMGLVPDISESSMVPGVDAVSVSVIAADASTVSATHSLFKGNVGGSAVIAARAGSTVDLAHSTFQQNSVSALLLFGETASLWLGGSVARLEGTSFIANDGGAAGAILVTDGGTATLAQGIFKYNKGSAVDTAAGAILATSHATVHAVQCEFTRNSASAPDAAAGAILASDHAIVHGTQCTFDRNSATSQVTAGAVYADGAAEVALTNATLSDNWANAHPTAGSIFGAGAVYADGSSTSLTHTNVANNKAYGGTELTEANYVDALYIASPLRIFVRDSTFEPLVWGGKTVSISPQILPGMIVQGSCQQHSCAQGSSCSYANFSSSCQPCPEGTYSGDGISCNLCAPGTGPSADQIRCEPCGGPDNPLAYSPFGVCLECQGDNVVSEDRTSCAPQGAFVVRDRD